MSGFLPIGATVSIVIYWRFFEKLLFMRYIFLTACAYLRMSVLNALVWRYSLSMFGAVYVCPESRSMPSIFDILPTTSPVLAGIGEDSLMLLPSRQLIPATISLLYSFVFY